ncbi:1-deoxy-D-xylulose-5-phosphate synthase [uncultured archaeon]|nr:1-deoxy-D-xylulose-5-phosphate synthase [uncultured archaeon]
MGIIGADGREKDYTPQQIQSAANEMRGYALISIHCAGSGHSGGSLSAMDLLSCLYLRVMKHKPSEPTWEDRDRLFFSAGHKAPAWYAPLGWCGYFDVKQTATLRKLGSPFQGHPDRKKCDGIEVSCGSLGQGLSVAVGDALAARTKGKEWRVYCLMGDGEQQEGQIWEAAMAAGHYKLDNLVGMVDKNELQIDGKVCDVMGVDPLADKYRAFGWHAIECNGHDVDALLAAFEEAKKTKGKPTVIIARTVKGKGVSFMEAQAGWHGKAPNAQELDKALAELGCEHLPKEEMKAIAVAHQKKATEELEASMPKFSKNYWWNAQEDMKVEMKPTRMGFGESLRDCSGSQVAALGADISGSINISMFYEGKPERKSRWFSMGIAEQSGTCVAAGLAKEGFIPFFGTYGVFAAGRALDQIRTTVAYGNFNVKIAGAHGGVSVGPDGATHQALEEIFQIAGLPNMNLLCPCDANETKKATDAAIALDGPCYIRYAREATPIVSDEKTAYKFGEATVIRYKGRRSPRFMDAFEHALSSASAPSSHPDSISIVACGPEVPEAMRAAWILKEEYGIEARVVNVSTIKPLDKKAIIQAAETGCVLTAEEHQKGGLGNLVASALLSEPALYGKPLVFDMVGVEDRFGESGAAWELIKRFGLSAEHIAKKAKEMVGKKK